MRLGVLGNQSGWHANRLAECAWARGHQVEFLDPARLTTHINRREVDVCHDGFALAKLDAMLVRSMPPASLEQVVTRMDVLWLLEQLGVPMVNPPKAIEACVDKVLCSARLALAGLPTPLTVACEQVDQAMAAFEHFGGDVVVKPIFGSEGHGLVRVTDRETAGRVFRAIEAMRAVIYVQEFVPNQRRDVRLLVLNQQVIGAMDRHAPADDFRTNASLGATCRAITPTEEQRDLALRSAQTMHACFAGVDLIQHAQPVSGSCWKSIPFRASKQWREPASHRRQSDRISRKLSSDVKRKMMLCRGKTGTLTSLIDRPAIQAGLPC